MATTISELSGNHINHALLIRITIDDTIYRLATTYKAVTYNSESYQALGHLITISEITDELKGSNADINLTISGIPTEPSYISLILGANIKGSRVEIYRAFLNPSSMNLQSAYLRYKGYVRNYSMTDTQDQFSQDATTTVVLSCASINNILENTISGRRTNPVDQKYWFPSDVSMDRVPTLHNTQFDFGKPYSAPTGGSPITQEPNYDTGGM